MDIESTTGFLVIAGLQHHPLLYIVHHMFYGALYTLIKCEVLTKVALILLHATFLNQLAEYSTPYCALKQNCSIIVVHQLL